MPSASAFAFPSTLTWAQAKARVARVSGSQLDLDMLLVAGYALEEAIRYWEEIRNWKYLLTSETITFVVGTGLYSLQALFKNPYSARTETNPRNLSYIDRNMYNLLRPTQKDGAGNDILGIPAYYTLFSWEDTGKIELLPYPNAVDTCRLNYYRRHVIPAAITTGLTTSDASIVDFPVIYQTTLLALGRMFYLADKGGSQERMTFWTKIAQDQIARAKGNDEFIPSADVGFVPGSQIGIFSNPNSVTQFLSLDD